MRRFITILVLAFVGIVHSWAYDFSSVVPTGQTLYYNIYGGDVIVTYPSTFWWAPYSDYAKPTGALAIPSTVTHSGSTYVVRGIDNRAFQYCSGLTSVNVGDSVTAIGDYAFNDCVSLTSVIVGNAVTTIGYQSFYGCNSLVNLTLGTSVVTIGDYAFYGCTALTSVIIPQSTFTIGQSAFSSCSSLSALTLGNSVSTISTYAFQGCTSLTSLIIPNAVTTIGEGAFMGCSALANVVMGSGVTTIYAQAFQNCTSLDSILLPDSITTIGSRAFNNCSSLTSITIPDAVTSIEGYTFSDCTSLISATIGNGVTVIGAYAFSNCTALANAILGSSVTTIGDYAFEECSSIDSVVIPDAVISIGFSSFGSCTGLTSLYLGSSLTSIGDYSFAFCNHLGQITIAAIVPPSTGYGCFFGANSNIPVIVPCESGTQYTVQWDFFSNYIQTYPYLFSAQSDNETMGVVQAVTLPTCANGSVAVVEAIADSGYHFTHWSNGSVENPLSLSITTDTDVVAFFAQNPIVYSVRVVCNDTVMGNVAGGGIFESGTNVVIAADAFEGYHFVSWQDADTCNPRTIIVTSDTTFTAFFEVNPPTTYTIIVISNDTTMGNVSGSGTYTEGQEVVISATALPGFHFVQWQDSNIEAVRTISVNSDGMYIAYFMANQEVPTIDEFELISQDGAIIVKGVCRESLIIYDVLGRTIVREILTQDSCYTMPQTGLYLVRVGDRPTKKIIVVK